MWAGDGVHDACQSLAGLSDLQGLLLLTGQGRGPPQPGPGLQCHAGKEARPLPRGPWPGSVACGSRACEAGSSARTTQRSHYPGGVTEYIVTAPIMSSGIILIGVREF